MGTRSNIGIVNDNNTVTGIYCHWDGYPEWNGRILLENYNTADSVRELVKLGDLSSLRPKLNPEPGIPHDFQNQQEGVVVAYGRDRGETGTEAKTFAGERAFERYADNSGAEYQYLFRNDGWWFNAADGRWTKLTENDCKSK